MTWYPLGGMIKIITNMPPRNSAIMRPQLDGMDKIKAFRRNVVAIVHEASEMTRGPTRVCPHEFSRILQPITVSGSSRASVGANRSTPYFCFLETKICFLGNKNSFPRIVGNKNSFPTYSIVTRPRVPPSQSCRNLRFSASGLSNFWHERHFSKSPVAKSRVVGEPIAESGVVGEPIVA